MHYTEGEEMKTHRYEPRVHHNVLGPVEPVLRVNPGDRIVTSTLDAHGFDSTLSKKAEKPNPMTGPFHVEGAEPGDTLLVHVEAAFPNRDTGWTSSVFRPNVVEPYFVKKLPQKEYRTWQLNLKEKTACPVYSGDNKVIELPLAPMLGCIGVAPPDHQAISTVTCGPHGGNMDYRGIGAGMTLYFPVFTEGALLFFGDGHAVQGDGEITGTGIETSFDVQCRLELLKGRSISWPRAENNHSLFTMGNASPMEKALQFAVTEMCRWLEQDFDIDVERASLILGQAAEIDVGNVISPDCTMVCKLKKRLLL
jgi:acetamidase/formamidase